MAQLIVRNLDEELVRRLKRRAAERGRSVEAEHRQILREALSEERRKSLKQHLRQSTWLDARHQEHGRHRAHGRERLQPVRRS